MQAHLLIYENFFINPLQLPEGSDFNAKYWIAVTVFLMLNPQFIIVNYLVVFLSEKQSGKKMNVGGDRIAFQCSNNLSLLHYYPNSSHFSL